MVMLGALLSATGLLSEESAMKALEALTPLKRKRTLAGNKEAIRRGIEYIADTKSKN